MNRKLVLIPTVLATAVMVGCNSDSGGPSGPGSDGGKRIDEIVISAHDGAFKHGYQLPIGYPIKFEATVIYTDGSESNITNEADWNFDEQYLMADDGYSAGELRAVAPGSTIVTVTYNGEEIERTLQVTNDTATAFSIEGRTLTLVEFPVEYTAITTFDNNQSHDITHFVEFEIDQPDVAKVEGNIVSPILTGEVVVSATDNHASYDKNHVDYSLEIVEGTIDDVLLELSGPDSFATGASAQLEATITLKDDVDNPFNVTNKVSWASGCESEGVRVSSTGVVTATAAVDECPITAVYGDDLKEATHYISSFEGQIDGIVVSCDAEKYFFGETQCLAHLTYSGSDEITDVTNDERTLWYIDGNNSDHASVEQGLVSSTAIGVDVPVRARFTYSTVINGSYELIVGLPSEDVRLVAADDENPEVFSGGSRQLLAYSESYDVTKAVDWSFDKTSISEGWSVVEGLVTAPKYAQSGDSVTVVVTSKETGSELDSLIIEVINLEICTNKVGTSDCISVIELDDTFYIPSPKASIAKALGVAYSSSSPDDIGYDVAKFAREQAVSWCNELSSRNLGEHSWAFASEDQLDTYKTSSGDIQEWPTGDVYLTSTMAETDDRFLRTYDLNLGQGFDVSSTATHYAACVSR